MSILSRNKPSRRNPAPAFEPAPLTSTEAEALKAALAHRRAQAPWSTDCLRLIDGDAEGVPRLMVDQFADAVRVSGGPERVAALEAVRPLLLAHFEALKQPEPAVFWRFGHEHTGSPEGDDGRRVVNEAGLRFEVHLADRRSPGLFPHTRSARAWVRQHSEGAAVLNLFAFTGGFGVAAVAGGARAVVHVDSAAGALERARINHQLNGQAVDGRLFWRQDAREGLKILGRKGARYNGIVLDPPPVAARSRKRKQRYDPERHFLGLVEAAGRRLWPEGWLMVLHSTTHTDEALAEVAEGEVIATGRPDADCPDAPGRGTLKWVVVARPAASRSEARGAGSEQETSSG